MGDGTQKKLMQLLFNSVKGVGDSTRFFIAHAVQANDKKWKKKDDEEGTKWTSPFAVRRPGLKRVLLLSSMYGHSEEEKTEKRKFTMLIRRNKEREKVIRILDKVKSFLKVG